MTRSGAASPRRSPPALAIGALYAINSWSYPAAAGLLVLAIATWLRSTDSAGRRLYALVWLALVLLASVVLMLPFWLNFNPAARGIGWVKERASFTHFVGDQLLLYGLFVGPLAAAFAARVLATRRPVRTLVLGRDRARVRAVAAGAVRLRRRGRARRRARRRRWAR